MQRDVGAAPGIGRGRQVVGVGFASDLEHGELDALGHFGAAGKPFGVGPALQHGLGEGVALVGLFLDVMELVEHEQRLLERFGSHGSHGSVVKQIDQRREVVAAQHGAQQLRGLLTADEAAHFRAMGHGGQVAGLDLGGIVHARRHTVRDQVDQGCFLASRRVFQQLDQFAGLLGAQGQWRNAQCSTFGHMVTVGFQHQFSPVAF